MSRAKSKKHRLAAKKRERDALLRQQRRNEVFETQAETKRARKLREDAEAEAARIAERRAEHNLVDGRSWVMVDACVGRTTELCDKLKKADIPHFRATDEVERILPSGRRQRLKVPLVARTVFVGVESREHLDNLTAKFPWLMEKVPQEPYGLDADDAEFPWVVSRVRRHQTEEDAHGDPVYRATLVPERQMKEFAEKVIEAAPIVEQNDAIKPGEAVRVEDGPFATYTGTVARIDEGTGDLIVDVLIFGRATPVSLHPKQVTRLDVKRAA